MYVLVVRLRTRPPLLLQGGGRVRKGANQHIHYGVRIGAGGAAVPPPSSPLSVVGSSSCSRRGWSLPLSPLGLIGSSSCYRRGWGLPSSPLSLVGSSCCSRRGWSPPSSPVSLIGSSSCYRRGWRRGTGNGERGTGKGWGLRV